MGANYSSAYFVVAWLCPQDEPTLDAIKVLNCVGKETEAIFLSRKMKSHLGYTLP
jgi:hypothetical protein